MCVPPNGLVRGFIFPLPTCRAKRPLLLPFPAERKREGPRGTSANNLITQKFKIGQKNELVSSCPCTKLPYPAARVVRAQEHILILSTKARPHILGLRACIAFQKSCLISKQLLYFLPYRINNRLWRKLLLERLIPHGKFYNPLRAGLGAHHNPQRHAQ